MPFLSAALYRAQGACAYIQSLGRGEHSHLESRLARAHCGFQCMQKESLRPVPDRYRNVKPIAPQQPTSAPPLMKPFSNPMGKPPPPVCLELSQLLKPGAEALLANWIAQAGFTHFFCFSSPMSFVSTLASSFATQLPSDVVVSKNVETLSVFRQVLVS